MEEKERTNEVEIKNSDIKEINPYLHEVCKSICKIKYKNHFGTGFFIKLFLDGKLLSSLMTNNHVIFTEKNELNENIIVQYNFEKKIITIKLDENERIIKYDRNMDVAIIEIIPDDKIKEKYFLVPNIDNINFLNQDIYIPQYPEGKNLSYSEGKIINMNDNELIYDASTKSGSSGSPIILKNSTKVIGIHKQGHISKTKNYGTCMNYVLKMLNNSIEFNAKRTYENGEYYIGSMLNNKKHGKGIYYYKNNTILYDGYFFIDKAEGKGKYFWEDGDYYDGQWKHGMKNGKGILYFNSNNTRYEGNFVNDKPEGRGKFFFSNGEYYDGEFSNNEINGKGKLYDRNGRILYDGDFVNGKFEGKGKYTYENGNYYDGKWFDDNKHGKGREYYKNGKIKFDGNFVNGEAQGYGKYIYENGDYYIGHWSKSLKNGEGTLYDMNGNIKLKGKFFNDKLESNCIII